MIIFWGITGTLFIILGLVRISADTLPTSVFFISFGTLAVAAPARVAWDWYSPKIWRKIGLFVEKIQ